MVLTFYWQWQRHGGVGRIDLRVFTFSGSCRVFICTAIISIISILLYILISVLHRRVNRNVSFVRVNSLDDWYSNSKVIFIALLNDVTDDVYWGNSPVYASVGH